MPVGVASIRYGSPGRVCVRRGRSAYRLQGQMELNVLDPARGAWPASSTTCRAMLRRGGARHASSDGRRSAKLIATESSTDTPGRPGWVTIRTRKGRNHTEVVQYQTLLVLRIKVEMGARGVAVITGSNGTRAGAGPLGGPRLRWAPWEQHTGAQ